jgi:hypothetical protein
MKNAFPSLPTLLLSLQAVIFLAAPQALAASLFDTPLDKDEIDAAACKFYGADDKETAPSPEQLYPTLGFRMERPQRILAGRAPENAPATFHYRFGFREPLKIGAIAFDGYPMQVRVLKPDAPYPGDPKVDSQWTAVEIPPVQGPARVVPLPPDTQTRAILLTDVREKGTYSQLTFLRVFKNRFYNLTPHAMPYAESEYTTVGTGAGPTHTYRATDLTRGIGSWQNTGPNNRGRTPRPPVSDVDPAWVVLVFPEPREIAGVWATGTVDQIQADYYDGPEYLNPRAGTDKEWKKIRESKSVRDPGVRLEFAEPVKTKGLRLRITKVSGLSQSVARVDALHVYTDLKDHPPPAIQESKQDNPPLAIRYPLERGGMVTMVINDAQGRRVRNVIARAPRTKGDNAEHWDLCDEDGKTVTPGTYEWKVITNPGLTLRYEMTPYPDVHMHTDDNAPWLNAMSGPDGWMADHTPPRAACVSGDRVYLGSPVSESGVSLIECDLTGKKLWAHPSFAGFTGTWWLAADEKTVYSAANAGNTAAGWKVDGRTEAVWAVDRATHEVRELARLIPTALRQRGIQGMAARDGKLYISVNSPQDWLAGTGSADDVDIEKCLPTYKEKRGERYPYEIVPVRGTN